MPVSVEVPETVEDVVGALGGDGAVVIAGGTQVMPRLNTEVNGIGDAGQPAPRRAWRGIDGRRRTTPPSAPPRRCAQLGADDRLAFLRPVVESIASPSIRNLATVGGNLFVAQPYGDLAVALLALDAEADLAGAGAATRARRGARPRRPARGRRRHRRAVRDPADVPLRQGDAAAAQLRLDRHRRRRAHRRGRHRHRRADRARRRGAARRAGRRRPRPRSSAGRSTPSAPRPPDAPRSTTPSRSPTPTRAPGTAAASCPSTSAAP